MAELQQDPVLGGTIGDRLKAAREAKGLALEDIAHQTRIPIRHLQHIERGEWDALPAITYSVGFARSYASAIGMDGAQVGAEVREELGATRTPSTVAAYYEPADPARVPPRSIALIAALLAILIIGGYLFWRSKAVDDPATDESPIVASKAPAGPAAAPRPSAAQPAPIATGPVVLTAIEDVWMRIDEAGGGPALYQGTLAAGQSYQVPASATAPQLRTGRANVLRVTVGGAALPPLGPPERTISNVSLRASDLAARAQSGGSAPATAVPSATRAGPEPGPVPED